MDLRFAFRVLLRRPAFALVAILTLASGIGAATAMFSVINGVLLRPLPITSQDRVFLVKKELRDDDSMVPFPVPDLIAFRQQSRAFESVAGVQYDGAWPWVADLGDQPVSINGALTSGEFFSVLGVRPALGRIPTVRADAPDAEPDAVISHRVWRTRFGGDPSVVGRTVRVMGSPVRIVGVAPEGFEYPRGAEMWVPLRTAALRENRQFAPFSLVGRLRAGATAAQARGEAAAFLRAREAVYLPTEPRGQRAVLVPFPELVVGDVRPALRVLGVAVLLVLVVAGFNLTNLLLMRAAEREREIALRAAIGASRTRIVRQMMTEGAALAVLGAVAGVGLAYLAVAALRAAAPAELPRMDEVRVDGWALLVAVAAALLTTLAASAAPALWAARSESFLSLRGGARSVGGSGGRGKRMLVVAQVAVALAVAAGAGLLTRSVLRLENSDPGFRAREITLVKVELPNGRYPTPAAQHTFFDALGSRVRSSPGVAGATPVIIAPFSGTGGWDARYTVEGQSAAEAGSNPALNREPVRPEYFSTLGIRVVRGRAFAESDREGAAPVAIVSEAMARRSWPGTDPVGKRMRLGTPESASPWLTVVGVVPDVRYRDLTDPPPGVYLPLAQTEDRPRFLAVRAAPGTGGVLATVRAAAAAVDPAVTVLDADPVSSLLAAPLARPRFNALVLLVFACLAVGLAAVGLYGVMASEVAQRMPEIGVRLALGAKRGDIVRMVVRRGMLLALAGVGVGLFLALGATRALRAVLFGVSASDPLTLLAVAVVLLLSALVACAAPALRGTRGDPMQILRNE